MTGARRNGDERLRSLERGYLASPGDTELLGSALRAVARTRGNLGMIAWVDELWRTNDLFPDDDDFDMLAEAVFAFSRHSEDLRGAVEAVERVALDAEARHLAEEVAEEDRDEDQRAPWWRRERFHDVDFNRARPWNGGRLYSPARGTFVTVNEIKVQTPSGKTRSRGLLLVETQAENVVEGIDAVLLDMARGGGFGTPGVDPRPLSSWALRRILARVAQSSPSTSPEAYRFGILVTDPGEDPTDIVESVIGSPAAPMGGAARWYPGAHGPMIGLWDGPRGRFEVMRQSGLLGLSRLARTALYHWLVAEHPYRVRLSELRTRYWEERGGEELRLIWVGNEKDPADQDEVTVSTWTNETIYPDEGDENDIEPYQESIVDQLGGVVIRLSGREIDWTEMAARDLHEAGTIVVEDWERPRRSLSVARRRAADIAYEYYDFGEQVEAANGWEFTEPGGDEWTRTVFLAAPDGGDSVVVRFTVTFGPGSDDVVDATHYYHAGGAEP